MRRRLSLSCVGLLVLCACGRQALDEADPSDAGGAPEVAVRVPSKHRAVGVCATAVRQIADDCAPGQHSLDSCGADGECTAGRNGRCTRVGPLRVCACVYDACIADEECPLGSACACNPFGVGNVCTPASCRVDQDCGDGGFCGPVDLNCVRAIETYHCYGPGDQCIADSDCGGGQTCDAQSNEGRWRCHGPVICR